MSRSLRRHAACAVLAGCIVLSGCAGGSEPRADQDSASGPDSVPASAVPDRQRSVQAAVYATVVRRVFERDDNGGGTIEKPIVYIVASTDDSVGDRQLLASEPCSISIDVQTRVTSALADVPSTVTWVDAFESVPLDERTGGVAGGGIIVTLGNVTPHGVDSVRVPVQVWVASLAASGKTYILKQVDGAWTIIGTTGTEWMS